MWQQQQPLQQQQQQQQHKHLHFIVVVVAVVVVIAVVAVCCMRVEQQKVRDPISMPQKVASAGCWKLAAQRQILFRFSLSCSGRGLPYVQHFNLPLRWQHWWAYTCDSFRAFHFFAAAAAASFSLTQHIFKSQSVSEEGENRRGEERDWIKGERERESKRKSETREWGRVKRVGECIDDIFSGRPKRKT